jgi:hypothetical protein
MSAVDQAQFLGQAWDRTPHEGSVATRLVVYLSDGTRRQFSLGAHAPDLPPDDVEHIHRLWLDAVKSAGQDVHHRDIVTAALESFEEEMQRDPARALQRLRKHG